MSAWDFAGLACVGHIVFPKRYVSAERYLRYTHECGYLLANGSPLLPPRPLHDMFEWHYSGNRRHPTEKAVETIKPLIEAFSNVDDTILDPYAGSGSTLVAAALLNRNCVGIEVEAKHCETARRRLEGAARHVQTKPTV